MLSLVTVLLVSPIGIAKMLRKKPTHVGN